MTDIHLREVIEQSPLGTIIFDPEGKCLLVNAAWHALWDSNEDPTLEFQNILESDLILSMGLLPYLKQNIDGGIDDGALTTPILLHEPARPTSDKGSRWLNAFIYPVRNDAGELLEMGLIVEDFTERKALEEQLSLQAFHDSLTGLPNRALFRDRLGHGLSLAKQHAARDVAGEGSKVALLFMDLDDFKLVNDSLGHNAGDLVLVEVAKRIETCLRPGDTFARLGGDEFAALIEDTGGGAASLAERIASVMRAPIVVDAHEIVMTISIGIVLSTPEDADGDEFMRRADIAMYHSKGRGAGRYEVFTEDMNGHGLRRLKMTAELRRAIEREEFVVHYQPLVLLGTGNVVGFEALVRWEHPERGLLAPSEFLSLAEESGLIIPIGRWVLAEACRQAMIFERIYPERPLKMIVNLSPRQFHHPELIEEVASVLLDTGLNAQSLSLEITEGLMMGERVGERETAKVVLNALKNLGVTLIMDDFGTGYSSIAYLRDFPLDMLKVDRLMIERVNKDPADSAIVLATISLAHALGLVAVAEGVETMGQLEELRSLGCDFGQGYYWRRPGSAAEIMEVLPKGLGV